MAECRVGSDAAETSRQQLETVYHTESRRVLATLIRLLGDFDRAEEAMHEAFAAAVATWTRDGITRNPRAWLVSTARFRWIDAERRRAKFDTIIPDVMSHLHPDDLSAGDDEDVADDQLRLIFTCCHPALSLEAQVALTLREVCGLTTEHIAHAFLTPVPTVAQRIVRAKQKIRTACIPYQLPALDELPARLDGVLHVIYLVFNEGYHASTGDTLTRNDLSAEAIRLGRLVQALIAEPEVHGLLGLMLLQESRREARATPDGDVVLLDAQDRTRWNRAFIAEGSALVQQALRSRRFGPYTLQAAIAAVHADAAAASGTDWAQIVGLYDVLRRADSSPIIALNRAVALAMRDGPAAGLHAIDRIMQDGILHDYHLAHSARADLLRRCGRLTEADAAYAAALALARQEPTRRFLRKRIDEVRELQRNVANC
jgi:RNA polymerase sigma-70 factor (ECF subfamily)